MHVLADRKRCDGYANCVVAAPDVFGIDDEGLVEVLAEEPPAHLHGDTEIAVGDCPVAALRIEGR